ncbi:hypothetical protein ACHQM5_012349 [Ranunculus cassubicifolius]
MAKRLVPSLNRVLALSKSVPAASLLPDKITKGINGTVQELCFSGKNRDAAGPREVHSSALLEALVMELHVEAIHFCSKLKSVETLQLKTQLLGF